MNIRTSMAMIATGLSVSTASAATAQDKSFFRDGDTWVLSGDSITYIDLYRQTVRDAIDHFHPGNSVKVISTAVWGQLTSEAKGKGVELKPQVVSIMLGMNNVIHHDYPVENDFSAGAAKYGNAIRAQVRQYQALGAEVILMVPTLTDETENSFFAPWNTTKGLLVYGDEIRRVAAEEHCSCVPVASEFEAAKKKLKARQTFITDGVHPYGWGQYEIARSIIHHLNVAAPFAKPDEPRGYNARELPPQDWTFAATNRFAAACDAAPEVVITAPESCTAIVRWSVEGTSLRGEEKLTFMAGVPLAFRPAVPPEGLPSRVGAISRMIVSATPPKDARPRMAVMDLARTRVIDMTRGFCTGEVRTDVERPEGPLVATWRIEEDGADLWMSGHSTASSFPPRPKPPQETWMNSGGVNGFFVMLDLRPADRFADNNFDRDMHMLSFSVIDNPWSVLPLAWEGRCLQNCIYANADRTDDGYDWRLGLRGYIANYVKFDIRKFDHIGVNFIFNDHNPRSNALDRTPAQPYVGLEHLTPERRLNQTMILDRRGTVPQFGGETTNVGVYAL